MLSKEQILTYLQLPQIGNVSVMEMGRVLMKPSKDLSGSTDMLDFLKECIENKIVKRVHKEGYSIESINSAFDKARRIIDKSSKAKIGITTFFDSDFPATLKNVKNEKGKLDNPLVIYHKGNITRLTSNTKGIAIVGTREPTPEGLKVGESLGKFFAVNKINVISGLALGCDASAHRGALKGHGLTTAFLAHGLDMTYPKVNEQLARDIVENGGLLMSEYPPGTKPMANFFVTRDRLQSGLADATLVIQTGITGGTMHAVNATIASGKPLYAVMYKEAVICGDEKVKGNMVLINSKKAKPVTSDTLQRVLELIKYENKEGPKDSTTNDIVQLSLDF